MNKKALSGIVTVVILIALTLALVSIVWVSINSIVNKKISESEACFGIFDKVSINSEYTCFQSDGKFRFSINRDDVDIDKLLVAVNGEDFSKSFKLNSTGFEGDVGLQMSDGSDAKLPEKDSGKTYVLEVEEKPDSIKIAPIVKGVQCDMSDELLEIGDCS